MTAEPEEIYIPVPWGHVTGRWWGRRDVQPVVALHGWQDNAGSWDRLAPLLVTKDGILQSLLALDLPGHGRSSHYPQGQFYYLYWDGVTLLRRVCRHFKWNKDVTLLGHSMGGSICFLYAANYPDEVSNLICIDIAAPPARPDVKTVSQTGPIIDRFLDMENQPRREAPYEAEKHVIDVVMDGYNGSLTRDSCQVLLKRGMKCANGGLSFTRDPKLKIAALEPMSRSLIFTFASRITCQVLNIRGKPGYTFEDVNYYGEVLEAMRRSARRLEACEVEGTHHLHLNTPERVAPIILDFLTRL